VSGEDPERSDPEQFDPDWLRLREQADARARARPLAGALVGERPRGPFVVHDLGCGTGSMARWLAPLLPGPQHWVLHDRDAELLARALLDLPAASADGAPVTAERRLTHLDRLPPGAFDGADLITASALLDLLTRDELAAVAAACVEAEAPALFTLSVTGRVLLDPPDALDAAVSAAFDAHQRRVVHGRRLLGPDAVAAAAGIFSSLGARVDVRPSPWRLGGGDAALVGAWLRGWVGAAVEQEPGLNAEAYLARRLDEASSGRLRITVDHADLLAHPTA
jgi:SAM-dependent methyltransferase